MDALPLVEGKLSFSPALRDINLIIVKEAPVKNPAKPVVVTSVIPKVMEVSTTKLGNEKGKTMTTKTVTGGSSIGFKHDEACHIIVGKRDVDQPDDLFKSLKFFLIIGRFLGIIPYSGVFNKSPKSPAAIISMSILAVLTVNLVFGVVETIRLPKRNAFEIAGSVRPTIQFLWAWLIYFNFLVRGKRFLGLFYYWAKTTIFYEIPDRHLKRDVMLITVFILTSAVLENMILHLEYFPALDYISGFRFENSSIGRNGLETYFKRSHNHWSKILPFHEVFSVIAFIQHKCMLYGCNYMDIMIAVFSRAIYFKFKMLYKLANEHLAKPVRNGYSMTKSGKMGSNGWTQLAQDHKRLCDLLQQLETFFSPLIFGSYAVNIFYICVQLLDGLTVDISTRSLVHSVYAPWSFLHIIMRIYVTSICAARVNSYAHQIRIVLQECPIDQYNAEIARLDKKVSTGQDIGLSGLGCFVVTKPLILKIISVVFTFEIVLLQGAPSSVTGTGC